MAEAKLKTDNSQPQCCDVSGCLLYDTPPVGIFDLKPKPMSESLIGKIKDGTASFKLGRGKTTKSSVEAAYSLLRREFPQVSEMLRITYCIIIRTRVILYPQTLNITYHSISCSMDSTAIYHICD